MSARRVTPEAVLVLPASAPREQWLAARRYRDEVPGGYCIGSSDVPSILDLKDVDTPAHVFHEKVNFVGKEETEAMRWGTVLEAPVAEEWCRRNRTVIRRIGLVSNVTEPWQQSTVDRRVVECPLGLSGGCGLEVKVTGTFTYKTRWHADVPDRILAQMVHQLLVTGWSHMHYVVLVGGNAFHQGVVYADREAELMEWIRKEVNAFRAGHLLTGMAPAWTAEDKVDRYLELDAKLHAERVGEVAITAVDLVVEYATWAKRETKAKNEKKRLKLELAKLAGGHEIVTIAGEKAYSYDPRSKTNTDYERLREKYPHVYADPEIVYETPYRQINIDNRYRKMAEEE